jgi:hypothetical protein
MQDDRDELEDSPVEFVSENVRHLFNQAGTAIRTYKWDKNCGYKLD